MDFRGLCTFIDMKRWILFSLPLLSFLVFSCGNHQEDPNITERKYDVSYGPDARNKMDVYLPAGRSTSTPFILLIHGGAWVAGNKSDLNGFQEGLLQQGIASASMNYRYASQSVHYPQLMQDVALAVDYCVGNADNWVIRKNQYMVGGSSAGAHMSLLYSYSYDTDNRVSGVISLAGPTDVTDTDWLNYAVLVGLIGNIEVMTGDTYVINQPLALSYTSASPRKNLKNVPTLMIHGTNDEVVFYSQSQKLDTALTNASVQHKLVTINGAGHDLGLGNPATAVMVTQEIVDWINTYGN